MFPWQPSLNNTSVSGRDAARCTKEKILLNILERYIVMLPSFSDLNMTWSLIKLERLYISFGAQPVSLITPWKSQKKKGKQIGNWLTVVKTSSSKGCPLFVVVVVLFSSSSTSSSSFPVTISRHEEVYSHCVPTRAGSEERHSLTRERVPEPTIYYSNGVTPPLSRFVFFLFIKKKKGQREGKKKSITNTERTTDSSALLTNSFWSITRSLCWCGCTESKSALGERTARPSVSDGG